MSEIVGHTEVTMGSEKGFAKVFAIVFILIGCFPLLGDGEPFYWAFGVAVLLLVLGYTYPKALALPNKIWFKFGILLGSIVAPIVMSLVYFLTVVPIGLIMQGLGKDLLKKKFDKEAESYWIIREEPMGTMRDQF